MRNSTAHCRLVLMLGLMSACSVLSARIHAAATLGVSAGAWSFGSETVGITSSTKRIVLRNTGTSLITLSSISLKGAEAKDFNLASGCESSLSIGASCMLSIVFKPLAAGTKSAKLSIADNAIGSPQSVTLDGIGVTVPGTPTVTLSPTVIDFGSEATETRSAAKAITITNSGDGALSLNPVTLAGNQGDDFAFLSGCASSLLPGASCVVSITFKPVSGGRKSARLAVTDDASGSPQTVTLTGTGEAKSPEPTLAASYWVPFIATPTPGTRGGQTGIFVLPSDQLITASPRFVSHRSEISVVGSAYQATDLYTRAARLVLGAEVYSAVGNDGKVHLYGISLNDANTPPVEHQITNLSFKTTAAICAGLGSGQTNHADATTFWLLLDIAGSGGCGDASDKVVVVRYGDSAATTPEMVDLPASIVFLDELIGADSLSEGILVLNETGVLSFYANNGFDHGKTVLSHVVDFQAAANDATHHYFDVVMSGTSANIAGTDAIYSIEPPGTATKFHDNHTYGASYVQDASNFYFIDDDVAYKIPLSTGAPLALFDTAGSGVAQIVGTNGSSLVLQDSSQNSGFNVLAVPTDAPSTTAKTLFSGAYDGESSVNFEAFMPQPLFAGDLANALIGINQAAANASSTSVRFASAIVTPNGAHKQPLLADSLLYPNQSSPTFFELQGVAQTDGFGGGATVVAINQNNFTKTELTLGGTAYHVPSNYGLYDVGLHDSSQTQAILALYTYSTTASAVRYKVAGVDLSSGALRFIAIVNTEIAPLN